MHHNLLLILFLLFIVFMLIMIGQKIKVSYPILLVLAGLAIGFTPGMPLVSIDPELIFLIFLPPLLYEAAWFTSWGDFWEWRRPIGMLAFGLVIITSLVVAFVSVQLIPGFTLALGFLLGGIISPPDAVAATSVLKNVKVPKRVVTILEGESLVNDASSLIVFRFALAAVITGQFSLQDAVSDFFIVSAMGIVIGLVVAHIVYVIHRFFPTTSNIDTALTLMTPYFMYMAAEQFHFSGVMAVVSGGLFLSYRSHEILTSGSTRLQAYGVWSTTIFVLNGLVFILIGLELPVIVADLGGYSISEAIGYGLIISLVAIVVRMLWVFPIAYVPKWFGQVVRMDHKNPTWKAPAVVGWAGMRGVVSLASALSVPVLLNNGEPFPHRNLILIITFIVILVTLVFQGLTLPFLIKWLGIVEIDDVIPEEEQEAGIQLKLKKAALARLTENYAGEIEENELVRFLKKDLEDDISSTSQWLESLECEDKDKLELEVYNRVLADLYQVKRKELFRLRKAKEFSDEEIRKQEAYLDLDEAKKYSNPTLSMNTGNHYKLSEFLIWTRRDIYTLVVLALIPTVLYQVLDIKWLAIPWVPIALIGTAAAFIVGFKNTQTYNRLWEARQIWGAIVNLSRSWGIMSRDLTVVNLPEKEAADIHRQLIYRHCAWLTALRYQLREPRSWENLEKSYFKEYRKFYTVAERDGKLEEELRKFLTAEEADYVLIKKNRAVQIMALQSRHLKNLKEQGLVEPLNYVELENILVALIAEQGKSERIKNFPYPRQFASINLFFIWLFVIMLPFGMLNEFQKLGEHFVWLTIPFSVVVSWVFTSMEKVGESTENPFEGGANDVPITSMSRAIEIDLREMLDEKDLPPAITATHNILM